MSLAPRGFDPASSSGDEEAATMSDPKTNTDTVRAYYELAFNEGKPEEAVAKYLGDRYIQHNPQAADGAEAFIARLRERIEGDVTRPHGVRASFGCAIYPDDTSTQVELVALADAAMYADKARRKRSAAA